MASIKNETLCLKDGEMDYIRFGSGEKNLIMIPGLGESLSSFKGMALPLALLYRRFSKDFTVYLFSRKKTLPKTYSTMLMAHDLKEAMDLLGIQSASLVGVSMGGMISQHFAAEYPQMVEKLVLVVTSPCPNPVLLGAIGEWVDLAKKGDHDAFVDSNMRLMYSEEYARKNSWLRPVVSRMTKPDSYERFFTQADACMKHDAMDKLSRIQAETLVVGGEQDITLSAEASRKLAAAIPNAKLKMYPQWGHGLYEEEKGFQKLVHQFLAE